MASEIKVDTIVNAGGDNDTGIDLATNDQILLKVANATRLTMNAPQDRPLSLEKVVQLLRVYSRV